MILLGAVLVSLIMSLICRGKLSRLADTDLRFGWLGLVSVALQLVIVYADRQFYVGGVILHLILVVGTYSLLIAMILLNTHLPGMWMMGAGMASNLVVMIANRGWMPISAETLARAGLSHLATPTTWGTIVAGSKDAVISHVDANLWFLGDVFVAAPLRSAFSIGDVFLAAGAFWFFWRMMRQPQQTATSCT